MQLPITLKPIKGVRLQKQLVEQISSLIRNGILLPGSRLPSTRELSEQLKLSRRTVVLSYERLIDDGIIETRGGSGTFVCSLLPTQCIRVEFQKERLASYEETLPNPRHIQVEGTHLHHNPKDWLPLDFRIGKPAQHLFPRSLWRRLANDQLDNYSRTVSDYADPAGHPLLKQAIADHLRVARGIICKPGQIIITAGAQEALNLITRLLAVNDKRVVVEDPCYHGAAQAFISHGCELVGASVTEDGLETDELPDTGGCFAYITPSHQFPLGVTMSQERRLELISWARRTGTILVEDDYDSDFRHNSSPLFALQALAPDCVVYVGTFSKSIGPGLRLGYAVFPESLVQPASSLKSVMNNGHPWLEQAVTAQFLSSGAFEEHLGRMRKCYTERRDTLMSALDTHFPLSSVSGFEGGMHLVWGLDSELPTANEIREFAKQVGVGIYTLAHSPTYRLRIAPADDSLVLLGYPSLGSSEISEAIKRIAKAVGSPRTSSRRHGTQVASPAFSQR